MIMDVLSLTIVLIMGKYAAGLLRSFNPACCVRNSESTTLLSYCFDTEKQNTTKKYQVTGTVDKEAEYCIDNSAQKIENFKLTLAGGSYLEIGPSAAQKRRKSSHEQPV
jgi:hypothetical protein